jgi:hypothetical protein
MKKEIKFENVWGFFIEKTETPSQNIVRLVDQLSISKLVLYTSQSLKQKLYHKFKLTKISMSGSVRYVDDRLFDTYLNLKTFFDNYINSEESIVNKKHELSLSINFIYEAILLNNENLEFKEKANELSLCYEKTNEIKKITIHEIQEQPEIVNEMRNHLEVRAKYLNMIVSYLQILRERIILFEIDLETITDLNSRNREIQLLEIWEGLVNENFFPGHSKIDLTKKRRQFFSVFNLIDRDYNYRHKEMKNKVTLGHFTKKMAKNLRIKHKFDAPPKIGLK